MRVWKSRTVQKRHSCPQKGIHDHNATSFYGHSKTISLSALTLLFWYMNDSRFCLKLQLTTYNPIGQCLGCGESPVAESDERGKSVQGHKVGINLCPPESRIRNGTPIPEPTRLRAIPTPIVPIIVGPMTLQVKESVSAVLLSSETRELAWNFSVRDVV
jgi:hypothetical protein